jgi:DNA mismatch endonuclease, patch repair protein
VSLQGRKTGVISPAQMVKNPLSRRLCPPVDEARSRIMASIRSKGNRTTELALARAFRSQKLSGWRRHLPLPGRPDFVFKDARVAVFVDGCFWHGCGRCYQAPKQNQRYWAAKVDLNRSRDARVTRLLRKRGWRVLRIWGHSLAHPAKVANKVRRLLM